MANTDGVQLATTGEVLGTGEKVMVFNVWWVMLYAKLAEQVFGIYIIRSLIERGYSEFGGDD